MGRKQEEEKSDGVQLAVIKAWKNRKAGAIVSCVRHNCELQDSITGFPLAVNGLCF